MKVDITGIDKGELIAALFNASQPMGMGFLQAHRGPGIMTKEYGQGLIQATLAGEFAHDNRMAFPTIKHSDPILYFDYLFGRPLKVDITENEVDPWGFDRDNGGEGTMQAIVNKIRARQN